MSLTVLIKDGTRAGIKRAMKGAQLPWLCPQCGKITNPGYRKQCGLCGGARPA